MSTKVKSISAVTSYALTHLSSILYRLHKDTTMKELAVVAKVDASTLSCIKNGSIKSISLARLIRIIENLEIEYTMSTSLRAGVKYYSLEMEGRGIFGRSDRTQVSVKQGSSSKLVDEKLLEPKTGGGFKVANLFSSNAVVGKISSRDKRVS